VRWSLDPIATIGERLANGGHRSQLAGPAHSLLGLHSMAEALNRTTPTATCASDATMLVNAAARGSDNATGTTSSVSDLVLNELFADEDAILAKVLTACGSGHSDRVLLASLATVRSEVSSRLNVDRVRSS
jgi:hypothetical protein